MIRDAVLGLGEATLPEALAVEPSEINTIDNTEHAPLQWAAMLGLHDKALASFNMVPRWT